MTSEIGAKRQANLFVIYVLGFLFTLHAALPAYVSSSFLSKFATEHFVGIIYSVSALFTIILFTLIPRILRTFGNYRTIRFLLVVNFVSILALVWVHNILLISLLFIANFIALALAGFNVDIFLESFSRDSVTGKIRGTLLSTSNIAWIAAPLIGSFILTDGDYWKIFIATAITVLPILFLLRANLKDFKDPEYRQLPVLGTLREIARSKNIYSVFFVSFLLQFFYSWMVIYTPIYLYTYIGFTWSEIGIMFSIMLLPFVLTEAPLGRLADTRWGEKEVMSVGFIVIALATGMIAFIESKNMVLWTTLLFISRIGASMVEIMSETYFFKKIDGSKANILGLFRTMRPCAYLVSPLLATALFSAGFSIHTIFIVLAIIMFAGIHWSLGLKDTL